MDLSRFGISGITTRHWKVEEDMEYYARHNLRHIGIWSFKCEGKKPDEIRALADKYGLSVANVCFAGLFTGMTRLDRDAAVRKTKGLIDFTKEVGAGCLLLVSGPVNGHSLSLALHYVREGLKAVTEYAEKKGVHLGLEALHPLELTTWSVVNNVSQALDLIEEIDSPYLGIFLDTYNNGWEPEILSLISRCAGKIKGVHLADWRNPTRSFTDRTLPGRGVLPVTEIVRAVEATGYNGPYELEIFSDELWEADYHEIIKEFKDWGLRVELEVSA